MGKLTRLTSKLYNTPHLVTSEYFDQITSVLIDRNNGIELAVSGGRERKVQELAYNQDTGVGILSIDGPLTYLEYEPMCGDVPTSYQKLESEMKAMAKAGAKVIVMDVDSPGGEAYGMFETAKSLRAIADEHNIKLIAYVDGLSASAAYGLSVAADEIIINPQGEAGSIGVVVSLANRTGAEKAMGIERTYVYAGESKVPFDSEGKFTEAFLADIQDKVDALYSEFIGHVAEMRNLTNESVRDTKAKVLTAQAAKEIGLVDSIMTREEFFTYLSEVVETGNSNMGIKNSLFKFKSEEASFDMNELELAQTQLSEVNTKLEATLAELATAVAAQADLQSQLAKAEEMLATFEAAAAEAEAKAKELAVQARKEKLSAVVGDEKAEELMTSLEVLDDAAFNAVVGTFALAAKAIDESPMMEELGVGAEGKKDEEEHLSLVAQIIQKKKVK